MNRIILTEHDAIDSNHYRLTDHRFEHIRDILRLHEGDTVAIGILNGAIGTAVIEKIDHTEILLACHHLTHLPPPTPIVDLICALPRPQTVKKVLWTIAAMGVRRLYFIRANRVEKSYFHSPLLQPEQYTPYLLEGLSQGKLTRLPEIHIINRFRNFFEDYLPEKERHESIDSFKLLPEPDASSNLSTYYSGDSNARLLIAVGPEGGWVPFEIALMESNGFRRFTLGRWILRVETAITAILGQVELLRLQKQERR